ncbi:MAG: acylphosphatase [Candidatus Omnitrophota bacterium]
MGGISKRLHIYYSGRVQGVGFRFTAEAVARKSKVSGFAKNLKDGRVEVVAEGDEGNLEDFMEGVRETMKRHIADEQVLWEPATGEFRGFGINAEY